MKIYTKGTALAAAAVFALATAAPAMADHDMVGVELDAASNVVYIGCESFDGLEHALDEHVDFPSDGKGQHPDRSEEGQHRERLEDKLTNALLKLHEDPPKPCDAAQKLNDFSFKVQSLLDGNTADKTKISETWDGAIQCLIDGSAALAKSVSSGESCGDAGSPPRGKGPKK